jgi:hypothetical protein
LSPFATDGQIRDVKVLVSTATTWPTSHAPERRTLAMGYGL